MHGLFFNLQSVIPWPQYLTNINFQQLFFGIAMPSPLLKSVVWFFIALATPYFTTCVHLSPNLQLTHCTRLFWNVCLLLQCFYYLAFLFWWRVELARNYCPRLSLQPSNFRMKYWCTIFSLKCCLGNTI
jgi:hypothetical protein